MPKKPLPDCDDVFRRSLGRWIPKEHPRHKWFDATFPDVVSWSKPGTAANDVSFIRPPERAQAMSQIKVMLAALEKDWPRYLDVSGNVDMNWITVFDDHWGRKQVRDLIDRSDPDDFSNELVVTVCEFGVALGTVMIGQLPQLSWIPDRPYFESALLDVPSGNRISVFSWAVKRFSEYGLEDGYSEKTEHCLKMVREGWPE